MYWDYLYCYLENVFGGYIYYDFSYVFDLYCNLIVIGLMLG